MTIRIPPKADIEDRNAFLDVEDRLIATEKELADLKEKLQFVSVENSEGSSETPTEDLDVDSDLRVGNTISCRRLEVEPDPTFVSVVDDFIHSGPIANGTIGSLNWNFTTGGGSTLTPFSTVLHPGGVYIATGATTGQYGTVYANISSYGFLASITEYRQVWIFRQHTGLVGDAKARFGLLDSVTYADNTNAICFELDSAGFGNNNWQATTKATSATNTNTGIAYTAETWMKFEIHYTAASVKFYIDDVLEATHTTNIPTTGAMMPVWSLWDLNNVARNMVLDYYAMTWKVAR